MKVDQNKSQDESLGIELDGKQLKTAGFVRGTAKSLTTLDIIGLAVLTVFRQGLFHAQQTDDVNPQEKVDK